MKIQAAEEGPPIENEEGIVRLVIDGNDAMDRWLNYKQSEAGQRVAQTITHIIISNVISIPSYAFTNLSNVHSVSLPQGLTTIGESAFSQTGLNGVVIPSSVTTIGDAAFNNISNLTTVTFEGTSLPSILGKQIFYGDESRTVYIQVPGGTENAYDSRLSATDEYGVNQLGRSGYYVGNIYHPPITAGTGIPTPEGNNPQSSAGQNSGNYNHTHTWILKEYVAATATEDATVVPICEGCGIMGSYTKHPGSAHLRFLLDTAEKINEAPQDTEVTVETELWFSLNHHVTDALEARNDVSLTIHYKYKGKMYTLTIPAGYDAKNLLDEKGWAGFRYIDSLLPGKEFTKEEWNNLKK